MVLRIFLEFPISIRSLIFNAHNKSNKHSQTRESSRRCCHTAVYQARRWGCRSTWVATTLLHHSQKLIWIGSIFVYTVVFFLDRVHSFGYTSIPTFRKWNKILRYPHFPPNQKDRSFQSPPTYILRLRWFLINAIVCELTGGTVLRDVFLAQPIVTSFFIPAGRMLVTWWLPQNPGNPQFFDFYYRFIFLGIFRAPMISSSSYCVFCFLLTIWTKNLPHKVTTRIISFMRIFLHVIYLLLFIYGKTVVFQC